jgi:hypothetical protein
LGVLAALLAPQRGLAQTIHVPPPSVPLVPYDTVADRYEVLLSITPDTAGAQHALRVTSELRVFANRLVITTVGGERAEVDFGDKTIGEVADYINAHFGDAVARTSYPEYSSRYLGGTLPTTLRVGQLIEVRGGNGGPEVIAEVGTVFAAGSTAEGGDGLLTSAGVQVSFAAQQALNRSLFLIFRIAFNTNDPQAVVADENEEEGTPPPDESDPVTGVLESSRRMSAGLTVNWYPIIDTRYRFGFNAEAEFSARRQDPFEFPMADVGGTMLPLDSLYAPADLERVRRELDGWRPNGAFLVGGNVEFPDVGGHPTYALAQVGVAAVTQRGVAYATAQPADPDSLEPLIETKWPALFRLGLGMWVADFVDLRADIVVPTESESALEPLLRLILSKPFR